MLAGRSRQHHHVEIRERPWASMYDSALFQRVLPTYLQRRRFHALAAQRSAFGPEEGASD